MTALETERLLLRRRRPADDAALAAMSADPDVMRHVGTGATLDARATAELLQRIDREWDERGFGLWIVAARERPGRALGFCGLTVPGFLPAVLPAVEVGWRLERAAWGRGVATEAARAAVAYGFGTCGLREIFAIVAPGNRRSLRVCAKLGMTARPDRLHPVTRRRVRVLGVRAESYTAS